MYGCAIGGSYCEVSEDIILPGYDAVSFGKKHNECKDKIFVTCWGNLFRSRILAQNLDALISANHPFSSCGSYRGGWGVV